MPTNAVGLGSTRWRREGRQAYSVAWISSLIGLVEPALSRALRVWRFAWRKSQSRRGESALLVTHVSLLAVRQRESLASSLTLNPKILGSYLSAFTAAAAVLTVPTELGCSLPAPVSDPAMPKPRETSPTGCVLAGIICG